MKVRTLIEILAKLDWNKEIYLANDSEGNSFSNPGDISLGLNSIILYPDDAYLELESIRWLYITWNNKLLNGFTLRN